MLTYLYGLLPQRGFFVSHESRVPYDFHEILTHILPKRTFRESPPLEIRFDEHNLKLAVYINNGLQRAEVFPSSLPQPTFFVRLGAVAGSVLGVVHPRIVSMTNRMYLRFAPFLRFLDSRSVPQPVRRVVARSVRAGLEAAG